MAAMCCRHFKALLKKNFIVWYRRPVFALCELILPAIMMAILCIIRVYVPSVTTNAENMLSSNLVAFPSVVYENGAWWRSTDGNRIWDTLNRPMMMWVNYTKDYHNHDPAFYEMGYDKRGPQFYTPTHCMQTFDYQTGNKQFSNIIGIIGQQTNITDSVSNYYSAIKKTINKGVKGLWLPKYKTVHYATAAELETYISSPDYKVNKTMTGVCMGIQHWETDKPDTNFTFSIHYPDKKIGRSEYQYSKAIPDQNEVVWSPFTSAPDFLALERYQHNGFSFQQSMLANQILSDKTDTPTAFISMTMQAVQTDTSVYDPYFKLVLEYLMPLFLLLGFIPPVYNITFKIVREKESRIKETMRIMGMADFPYWASWFVFYMCLNAALTLICWLVLLTNVVKYSNFLYVWLFFWLYGQAIFGQIIFLQSLFQSSKYAGIVSTVIYFLPVLVNKLLMADDVARSTKMLASLLPQVALMQGSSVFGNYESTGVGINYSTSNILYYGYSFDSALYMLAFDCLLYTLIGLYLDKVIPSDFGQRLNPCFLCMPKFYRCCRQPRRRRQVQNSGDDEAQQLNESEYDDTFERAQMEDRNYEAPPPICRRLESSGDYLRVQNLQKTFSGGFRAVRGVNVKMFDSQVFALLGHNGAGKTTVISMLTGLIKKSHGDAHCYDVDLFEEMEEVREFMGVCPQHDVLFDLLTPREHLEIFYDFKGGNPTTKQREINALIEDSGLHIDQNKISCTLSGGNKRKTSVCVALCGGSKLVMLDEPTSGMDLGARRNLWDMLKSYKKDRIIVLTTHYMDEADVLGDRIGIMIQGEMKCIGSPLFLKNRFGVGYRITFVKKQRKEHPELFKYLQTYFQGVQKAGEVHDEVSYVIPKSESNNFGAFFESLDTRLDDFEIRSYGVSMSNLEDVFLKINKEYAPDLFGDLKNFEDSKNSSMDSSQGSIEDDGVKKNYDNSIGHSTQEHSGQFSSSTVLKKNSTERETLLQHSDEQLQEQMENLIRGSSCARTCTASAGKRLIIYQRDWCGLICQIVIPMLLVFFGLWLMGQPTKLNQSPPRPVSTGFFPNKQRILLNEQPVMTIDAATDVSGAEIARLLPNATDAFEVSWTKNMTYVDFYNSVYAARQDGPEFPYRYGSFQIFKASRQQQLYQFTTFLNATSQDSAGMYPQFMYTAILRAATGIDDLQYNIITTPFPIYQQFKDQEEAARATDFTFMTAIALSLIPCTMIQFILVEREKQLKHQQLLSGMSLAGYWISNLLFDVIMAYIPIGLILLLMALFGKMYEGVWVLFVLYPLAIVPFTYVCSFCFDSDVTAQIMTLIIHFLFAAIGTTVVYVFQSVPFLMLAGDHLRWAFTIVPSYCVTHGIIWSANGDMVRTTRMDPDTGGQDPYPIPEKLPDQLWAWYNLKGDAVILLFHFVFWLFILMLIELEFFKVFSFCCPKISYATESSRQQQGPVLIKDDDVIEEEKRVENQRSEYTEAEERENTIRSLHQTQVSNDAPKDPTRCDCIRVNNFQKIYEPFGSFPVVAVRQASFGLDYGECFALLGVNGAGKSTTFKSLTKEIVPTMGEIQIQGFDVQNQFSEARKLIGYCPQYDAIFPILTVEETLKYYALIKGIRTHKIKEVVDKAIRDLNLKDHKKKLAGTLSGGNKRKLSVAMAIMGNPPIILLDEPSAGMDPEARRFMWQVVEKISQRDKKSAVILTTHSMEEAEALSTKMGIMVRGGVFRCMGSTQHIKNKFGVGFEVEIKVKKAQFNEIQDLATRLSFSTDLQSRVNLQNALGNCEAHFDQLILEQIRLDGLGSDLVLEAEQANEEVRLKNLLEFLSAQEFGFRIINFLAQNFQQVELLEQCGEYFKLRVPKQEKTIGWLFGQLEHEKRSLGIQEYSVSQTTLEQIFQVFANQSIASDKAVFTFRSMGDRLILVNPDGRMTDQQEELSQRGLSFHGDHPMKVDEESNRQAHSDYPADPDQPKLLNNNRD